MQKINKIIKFVLLLITGILISSCSGQDLKFNFTGRKVLYSSEINGHRELILLNIDTNDEINFGDKFDDIDQSEFLLFNEGKNILINPYNVTDKIYVYDILKDKNIIINIHENNTKISDRFSMNIYDNDFYFSNGNRIFEFSLNNYGLVNEYSTDSDIAEFTVLNKNIVAVTQYYIDLITGTDMVSPIILYDFKNTKRDTIPSYGRSLRMSKDGKHLAFLGNKTLMLMNYPSCKLDSINNIKEDSLKIFQFISFIDSDEIIFAGYRNKEDFYVTANNLYLLNIKTGNIRQITNSKSLKKIKSTYYKSQD